MEGRARTVLAAIVVVLVLGVPVAVLFASGGGDEPERAGAAGPALRLELSPSSPELLVYVAEGANRPERAGGARSVTLRCLDAEGVLVAQQDEAWPFADTDGGTIQAHAHVPLDQASRSSVRSCRLQGTDPPVEGFLR